MSLSLALKVVGVATAIVAATAIAAATVIVAAVAVAVIVAAAVVVIAGREYGRRCELNLKQEVRMYCVSSDRESCHCSCITGDESLTVIAFPRLALKTPLWKWLCIALTSPARFLSYLSCI